MNKYKQFTPTVTHKDDPITYRRQHNQVLIDTWTYGEKSLICAKQPYSCSSALIDGACMRCSVRCDMEFNPYERFIGFTMQLPE